ncbi:unnamed protein product [Phytophthora fragariaefolia]|uniref:Unnamed protein product n=1 Tax=Phytophthora fragariaefolia TaxID=1490495 RepID=A0A9W6UEK6_9STRA|nr:unnamed protein product [Phytophthora fragariaefolia]
MNHVDRGEDELAISRHEMRSKMTKCASQRCVSSGERCCARNKILKCQGADFTVVFGQGEHPADVNAPPSPVEDKLTKSMKNCIDSK